MSGALLVALLLCAPVTAVLFLAVALPLREVPGENGE